MIDVEEGRGDVIFRNLVFILEVVFGKKRIVGKFLSLYY